MKSAKLWRVENKKFYLYAKPMQITERNNKMEEENMFLEYPFENEDGYERGSVEYYKELCYESAELRYDTQRIFEKKYTQAVKNKDYELLHSIFYHEIKLQMLPLWQGGCDHSYNLIDFFSILACDTFDNVYRVFPEGLPLAANGHTMCLKATNLVLCMLYNKDGKEIYDEKKVIDQASKYINSKQPAWDRAFVACVLAIAQHDMDSFSENLQKLCEGHSRRDIIKYKKIQCDTAYGLIVFAKYFCTKEEFNSIRYPEYKNFDKGYIDWFLSQETLTNNLCFDYEASYEEMNHILKMPIAKTYIHQPHLGSDNPYISAKAKKDWYLDCGRKGRMLDEFCRDVVENMGKI